MIRRWIPVGAAAISLAFALGCNKHEDTSTTKTTAAANTTPAPLADGDKKFLTKAAQGGMMEVALGQQAKQKGVAADVKSFGDRMVTDHGKANDELKQLAAKKGFVLPTQLDDDHAKQIDKLSKLSGVKFDEGYADKMVDDHKDDVKEFKDASTDLKDPDIRAWAAKTLPVLEDHLTMAKTIEDKTDKEKKAKK